MKHAQATTTKTTTTTNQDNVKLETIRKVQPIPLQMIISITSPAKDNKELARLRIPFVPAYSSKGVKCKESVKTDDKGNILSVKTQEFGKDDGVLQFVPSDDSQILQADRSSWAKSSAYLGVSDKMLIQGIAENLRIILCSDNKAFNHLELKGKELRDTILNFTPTKMKEEGIRNNAKDMPVKANEILDEF
jgi:hypothetical protein